MGRHSRPRPEQIALNPDDDDLAGLSTSQVELVGMLLRSAVGLTADPHVRRLIAIAVAMEPAGHFEDHRRRFRHGCRILNDDAHRHGTPDAARAFAPAALDRAIQLLESDASDTSRTTYRSDMTRLARVLCPELTPPRTKAFVRASATAPATSREVRALWDAAVSAPPVTAERLRIALALCGGAGARPEEAYRALIDDVTERRHASGAQLCVNLANVRTAVVRTVPVVGGAAIEALREAKTRLSPGAILLPRGHNSFAEVQQWLQEHGYTARLSSRALRHYWISLLAQSGIPTATLMYLADVNDTKLLQDLQQHWHAADIDRVCRWVREAVG